MNKAILFSKPNLKILAGGNCLVAAIIDNYEIGFCQSGDQTWVCVKIWCIDNNGVEDDDYNDDEGIRVGSVEDDVIEDEENILFINGKTIF